MSSHSNELIRNKEIVRRFNLEVIQGGSLTAFAQLVADEFVNHTAAKGMPGGKEGMLKTFNEVLRPGIPDMMVEIHDQIAEEDTVVTRKSIVGTHLGTFMGIPATGKRVQIDVIDIVRVRDGRYREHWGINNLPSVLAQLKTG